jgi:hypothetical protein
MTAYSKDASSERLLLLSDEVSRIAGTLARLSTDAPTARAGDGQIPEISADQVLKVLHARRMRSRFLPDELFADPAWDMMLDLLYAELSHQRVSVSKLCAASAVPATTALRWITTLVERGVFTRRADPHDARRFFVELSPETSRSLRRYFAEVDAPTI